MPKRSEPTTPAPKTDAERLVLGLLIDYPSTRARIMPLLDFEDFQSSKHRKLFLLIKNLYDRGQAIDNVILLNDWLASGDITLADQPLSYLISLSAGLPEISNPESYIGMMKEYRALRKLHLVAQDFDTQVMAQLESTDIIADVQGKLQDIERASPALDEVPRMDAIVESLGGALEVLHPTQAVASIKTGFARYDALTTGLEPGALTIVAGRPGSGKSAFMMCVAHNIAEREIPVAVFSLEMNKKSLLDRMICVRASVDYSKFRAKKQSPLEDDELRLALERIYGLPLYIDDRASHSLGDLSRKIDRLVHKHGVRVVALDYAQLLTSGSRRQGDRRTTTEVLGEVVEGLKAIAKRLNIAFVLLSQLSRDSEKRSGNHRPMLSDLRDSGALEQVADIVVFCYREFQYKSEQEHLRDYCELIVAKQRNGPTGLVPMRFFGSRGGRFEDV